MIKQVHPLQGLRRHLLAASLALCAAGAHCAPVTYTIVSKISRVNFNLEHQGFIQLFGTLKIAPGSLVFDNEDWSKSSVVVDMPTKKLDMGDALWNGQIRGDESWAALFKAPNIRFRSTRVERQDDTHGTMAGDLTIGAITKPVLLQMRVNKIGRNEISEKSSIGVSATTTIKRSQFGLDAYADLVGDELAVQIQLEAAIGPDPDAQTEARLNRKL